MAEGQAGGSKPFDPLESFRGLRDIYLDTMAKAMVEAVNTESYAKASGAMLDTTLTMSAPLRDGLEKSMLQVLEQSHALTGLVKESATTAVKGGSVSTAILLQTVEQTVIAQKKALDDSAAQGKAAFDKAKQYFGLTGTPAEQVVESFQHGVNSLIATQKELLDIAAKPFTTVN